MSHIIGHTQIEEDMSENAEKIADSDMTAKPEETVMGGVEKKEAIKSLQETVAHHEHLLGSLQVHAEVQKQVSEMIYRMLQDVQHQLAVISSQLGLTSKAQPEIYESGKVEIKLDDSGTKLHQVFDTMSASVNTKTFDQLVQKNEGLDSSIRQPNDYGLSIHGEEMKGEELLNRTVKLADPDMTAKPEETVMGVKKRKMRHTIRNTQRDEDMSENAEKIGSKTLEPEQSTDEEGRNFYTVRFFPGLSRYEQGCLILDTLPNEGVGYISSNEDPRIKEVYMTEEEADKIAGLADVEFVMPGEYHVLFPKPPPTPWPVEGRYYPC